MNFTQYRNNDPLFHDPRFQRRIVSVARPIPIVGNMFDVVYECGHSPLIFSDAAPTVGASFFCPGCYEEFCARAQLQ